MTSVEQRVDRLEDTVEILRDVMLRLVADGEENRRRIEQNEKILAEMRRENRQTQRIWIAIARKQELFDDDEFQDVFGDEP